MSKDTFEIKSNLKKILPLTGLILLTVLLMLYFKENRSDFGELVQKGTSNLLAFYTQNLEPLLSETDITKEDVFNFAMQGELPLNRRENTAIKINNTSRGSYYEIQTMHNDTNSVSSYSNYIRFMNLTAAQKVELDSLLEVYNTKISEAVFVNDKKTIAINSRLAGLQKALLADIVAFSQRVNKEKTKDILGPQLSNMNLAKANNFFNEIKSDTSKHFIVIAEDTVFTSKLRYDSKKLAKRIDSLKQKVSKLKRSNDFFVDVPSLPEIKNQHRLNYRIDSNRTNIYQDFNALNWGNSRDYDSLMTSMDSLQKKFGNFNFRINFDSLGSSLNLNLSAFDNDSLKNIDIDFDFSSLGDLINKSIQGSLNNKDSADWDKFGLEMDSLARQFIKVKGDTTDFNNLQKKMKELQKLKKLQKHSKEEK